MDNLIKIIGDYLNILIWKPIIRFSYEGKSSGGWREIKTFWIWQKVFRINGEVPWKVHPSSKVTNWQKIKRSELSDLGASAGCYIQAGNGIILGKNILLAPNVGIISANHDIESGEGWKKEKPIIIGNNVWIGMNAVILPGVTIGNNVVVGAGSIVTKDIPSNSLAAGNPCRVIRGLTNKHVHDTEKRTVQSSL